MTQEELLIHELAEKAGVTVRTIRYYVEEGLLPAPTIQGRYSYFKRNYLDRLELIRRLKDSFLPLSEIREIMISLSDGDVRRRLREEPPSPRLSSNSPPPSQIARPSARALDYIDKVMDSQTKYGTKGTDAKKPDNYYTDKVIINSPRFSSPVQASESSEETWQRISFVPGVELHIRKPLDPETQSRVHRLISFAMKIFRIQS